MLSVLNAHVLTAVSGLFLCSMQFDFVQDNLAVCNRIMLDSSFIEAIKEKDLMPNDNKLLLVNF